MSRRLFAGVALLPGIRPAFMKWALHTEMDLGSSVTTLGTFASGLLIREVVALLGAGLFAILYNRIRWSAAGGSGRVLSRASRRGRMDAMAQGPRRRGRPHRSPLFAIAAACLLAPSCTVHPRGEREERLRALEAGAPFACPFPARAVPPLSPKAGLGEIVHRALLVNAEVETAYWEWRAALERVPQAGTAETNVAVFGSHAFGAMGNAWERTTLGLQTDPMTNIPPRSRLCAAALQALEEARAAGWRFEQAKWDLRTRVYEAWLEYALLAERIRVVEENVALVAGIVESTATRVEADQATQQNLLAARTTLDLAKSEEATLLSRVPGQRATLNALLSRAPDAPLDLPAKMPDARTLRADDGALLGLAASRSPALTALAAEVRAGRSAIDLARTRYLPEFALTGSIMGSAVQTLGGMISLPILRRDAIAAAVEESRAGLRAVEERRRQAGNDLAARVLLDLYGVRDAERQVELYRTVLVPRAEQSVDLARTGYSVGRTGYLELRDAQRTLLETDYALAELRAARERRLADLEAAVGSLLAP